MRSLKTALVAAVAAVAAAAIAAPAFSQAGGGGASVAVINSNALFIQSEMGKDMAKKINDIARQMQAETQPDAQRLVAQRNAFQQAIQQKAQAGQSREQIGADPTLRQQLEAIERGGGDLDRKVNELAADLAFTRETAFNNFLQVVDPVLDQVMTQRGITLVLQADSVAKGRAQTDLTTEVLAALNARQTTMQVQRLKAPPPPQPLAPTPAPAAPKK